MRMVVNSSTTFFIADQLGDITPGSELGLYHEDARFLSRYELTLDRRRPLPLSAHATDSYSCVHFATNPRLPSAPRGTLSLIRRRLVDGDGLHEDIELTNYGDKVATVALCLTLDADFAHLFEVRHALDRHHVLAQRQHALRSARSSRGQSFSLSYRSGTQVRRLAVQLSERPASMRHGALRFSLRLAPRERWRLTLTLRPQVRDVAVRAGVNARPTTDERIRAAEKAAATERIASAPLLTTDNSILKRLYAQSVRDFAALRITDPALCGEGGYAVAAGIPWFMTLFGRDSLIAAYQALPFFPEAAAGTLRALARLQGTRVDPARAEQPGKILHEHRHTHDTMPARSLPFPYYGTIDATPLFLILLAALYQTTRDLALARELLPNAKAALEWMDAYGDRDGDGYLEYLLETDSGLDNQGWKDSGDAIRFRDGRRAEPPIALCEVQGYAYAARLGMADLLDALGSPAQAYVLRASASALKERFNRDFWMPDRGYYAFALDGAKRQVDAITSNPGHLLWTGIADGEKAELVARRLLSPDLFSGWGVRTMATTEAGYNPISYHCGSIWPHDNSLIALGLARYGFRPEAAQIADALLHAGAHQTDHRLPELFAGYDVAEAPIPVEYFGSNRPQAWATGSVFLLLGAMAGVAPLASSGTASREAPPATSDEQPMTPCFLPDDVNRLRLDGVWLEGRRVRIELAGGRAGVERTVDRAAHEAAAQTTEVVA